MIDESGRQVGSGPYPGVTILLDLATSGGEHKPMADALEEVAAMYFANASRTDCAVAIYRVTEALDDRLLPSIASALGMEAPRRTE